jgi:hypothetical protein
MDTDLCYRGNRKRKLNLTLISRMTLKIFVHLTSTNPKLIYLKKKTKLSLNRKNPQLARSSINKNQSPNKIYKTKKTHKILKCRGQIPKSWVVLRNTVVTVNKLPKLLNNLTCWRKNFPKFSRKSPRVGSTPLNWLNFQSSPNKRWRTSILSSFRNKSLPKNFWKLKKWSKC